MLSILVLLSLSAALCHSFPMYYFTSENLDYQDFYWDYYVQDVEEIIANGSSNGSNSSDGAVVNIDKETPGNETEPIGATPETIFYYDDSTADDQRTIVDLVLNKIKKAFS